MVRLWQSGSLKRLWLVVILALRQATGEGAWLECGAEPGKKGTQTHDEEMALVEHQDVDYLCLPRAQQW